MGRFTFSNTPRDEYWFRVGTVDVTTTILITALASISLFVYAIDPGLLAPFILTSSDVTSGQIWRLITWPLLNTPSLSDVIGIALFFYFGREVERMLGRIRFLRLLIILTLLPALIATLFAAATRQPLAVGGMTFLEAGVLVVFVSALPRAMSFFNIPLWVLAAVILGVQLLQYTGLRAWSYAVFLILMVVVGLLVARAFGVSQLDWVPKLPLPAFLSGDTVPKAEKQRRKSAKLRVVGEADMDRLLDKIAEQGIGSLTADERRRLDEYSKHRGDN